MISKDQVINEIQNYRPINHMDEEYAREIKEFVDSNELLFSRKNEVGHITVSAIAWKRSTKSVAMIFHQKLNRWLTPGGHVEFEIDPSLQAAAKRELIEETGITSDQITTAHPWAFDIDVHVIPSNSKEASQKHFDFRFLFEIEESLHANELFKWVSLNDLVNNKHSSLSRFAKKLCDYKS